MAIQIKRSKLLLSALLPISALLLLLLILELKPPSPATARTHIGSVVSRIQTTTLSVAADHCSGTLYPDLCVSTVAAIPQLASKTLPQVITTVINKTADSVASSADSCASLLRSRLASYEPRQQVALADCLDLFDQTMTDFNKAVADLDKHPTSAVDHLQTVLSAAITNQYSCLDGFAFVNGSVNLRPLIEDDLFNISRLISNSLAMTKKIPVAPPKGSTTTSRQAFEGYGEMVEGFPGWVDREAMDDVNGTVVPDLVVAQDGTGNFTTIMEAVNATEDRSKRRIVIYIKAGGYFENVEVVKKKTNLMFVGDGIGKTVIKASRNVVDGWTTYRSATVAIVGDGFLARDLTIENAAGPSKHQAVALRNNADLSAFYRCSFVGYQDTLYTHSMRQFYKDCDVYGTVDFIFGNAAVVFQNCNLYARKPDENQKNIFTAQGREDPNQNTGISIQKCKVAAAADLIPVQSQFKSYLGRPWKKFSRTVFLQSFLDSLIEPAGWLEWDGEFALDTLYYREYMNRGPGSNTSARVMWPGYKVINNSTEVSQFTVAQFIQGSEWLPATSVPFMLGLA